MKPGDKVKLRPAHEPEAALVIGKFEGTAGLFIEQPPEWLRKELQERGIFIGLESHWKMCLFADHNGEWTDAMSLKHYAVEE